MQIKQPFVDIIRHENETIAATTWRVIKRYFPRYPSSDIIYTKSCNVENFIWKKYVLPQTRRCTGT